jgi:DNA-binding FrmR family transcriptional regulator
MYLTNTPKGYNIQVQAIPPAGMFIRRNTMNEKTCCCERTKSRSEQEKKDLMNRLRRIEGQVRGLQNMLESDAYCTDVLIQVSAVNSALNSFSRTLLSSHMKSCVAEDLKNGKEETIDELVDTLQKVMK